MKKISIRILSLITLISLSFSIFPQIIDKSAVNAATAARVWSAIDWTILNYTLNQYLTDIIDDGFGNPIYLWTDYRTGGDPDYYVQKVSVTSRAKLWGTNGTAVETVDYTVDEPVMVKDGSGGVIVVWVDDRNDDSDYDIYAQRINSSGAAEWTTNGIPIATSTDSQWYPAAVSDEQGGAIIAWTDGRGANTDIYVQRVDGDGNVLWVTDGIVVCNATGNQDLQFSMNLVTDGTSGAFISWKDYRGGASSDIYMQHVDANGNTTWTTNGVPVVDSVNNQWNESYVEDGNGGVFITWADQRVGTSDTDIYAQHYNSSGTASWATNGVSVSSQTSHQNNPEITQDGTGGIIVVWTDIRDTSDYDLYAQRLNSSGVVQWTAGGVQVANSGTDASTFPFEIAAHEDGGAVVIWEDRRGTPDRVYSQWIDGSGTNRWDTNGALVQNSSSAADYPQIAVSSARGDRFHVGWTAQGAGTDIFSNYIGNGNQILNVPGNMEVEDDRGWSIVEGEDYGLDGSSEIIRLLDTTDWYYVAEVLVDMTSDRDWSSVVVDQDFDNGISVVHDLVSAPGTASSYTLLVPIPSGSNHNAVRICPNATSVAGVTSDCAGGYIVQNPQIVDVNEYGDLFWAIDGMTGTGGMSIFDSSIVRDTLTRLQVTTASDHLIEFGTANGLTTSGDTIEIQFDPSAQSWDLGSIALGDIDLEDDGTDKTLAAGAGADIWGVNINTTTDTITFTAPTSGTDYIASGSSIIVKIGTNADGGSQQIVNPGTAGTYEVSIINTYSGGVETGEAEVPIVDDDIVNVTSFIDSFILFDIDTSDINENCDSSGGVSPCDSHSGSSDDAGYIVDLGEMSLLSVSTSGDNVLHADGNNGSINYVFFDLSTNSNSGATVTLLSLNGALNGPGSNTIPSVTNDGNGVSITAGSGLYGIREVGNNTSSGSFTIAGDYNGTPGVFGEASTSATQIFSTSGVPLDNGRLWMEIGVSPDSSDGTGTYTDQLTFIAVSTF